MGPGFWGSSKVSLHKAGDFFKVADLSPKNIFGNRLPQMVPRDLNIGETRVWAA